MSVPPPNSSQPPPGYPPAVSQQPSNLVLPPSLTSQPPPNIQALLKSIPSLQTIQQATAAAAAAAAASTKTQNASPNFPPPMPQRFGDVDERMKPPVLQPAAHAAGPASNYHQVQQPPPAPLAPASLAPASLAPAPLAPVPNYHQQQPIPRQPPYAEEGPSHIDYPKSGSSDYEQYNGEEQYADGDKEFYNQPSSQFQNNAFPPHNRGRPRGGGFYRGRGEHWRKS
ncbi:unnamed protein product [Cylicostephanus goldi]|uniref:Uncharacterized protein n=1 Tax=Cylicostephanus goldi TaxID=71465 RepID=A0A3P6R661_CYLGO|nr:unnamed protein product [Cylicostephanus goldi]